VELLATTQQIASNQMYKLVVKIIFGMYNLHTTKTKQKQKSGNIVKTSYCSFLYYNIIQLDNITMLWRNILRWSSALKMEKARTSETMVSHYHTAWSQNSKSHNLNLKHC